MASDYFRPEVAASNTMSGAVVDPTAVDVNIKFSGSRLNRFLEIHDCLTHFVTHDERRQQGVMNS